MKKILFLGVLVLYSFTLYAQKQPVNFEDLANWPNIDNAAIQVSNDGKYVSYIISTGHSSQLIIQATDKSWKKEIPQIIIQNSFTQDSRRLIFSTAAPDSVGIMDLKSGEIRYISHTSSYQLTEKGNGRWMICLDKQGIFLEDLFSKSEKYLPNVKSYRFDPNGNVLIAKSNVVLWLNLQTGKIDIISHQTNATDFTFGPNGKSLAFLTKDATSNLSLYYYHPEMDSARIVAGPATAGMNGMNVGFNVNFSKLGDKLFFDVQQTTTPVTSSSTTTDVSIWSYLDDRKQNQANPSRKAWIDLDKDFGVRILQSKSGDYIAFDEGDDGGHVLMREKHSPGNTERRTYDYYLYSIKDNSRKLIKKELGGDFTTPTFSASGKFVYWFDEDKREWVTYSISTGASKYITSKITTPLCDPIVTAGRQPRPCDMAGWLKDDASLLIYDQYDVWKVDPEGIKPPINVTNGYGLKNHIKLRCFDFSHDEFGNKHTISDQDTLLVWGFNTITKQNSLFQLCLSASQPTLKKVYESNNHFFYALIESGVSSSGYSLYPIKAKNANVYLFRMMAATEYPNLSVTTDFKTFTPLTDLQPQKAFNWCTSELVRYKLPDGTPTNGVLYKPEDFDPHKRYPVIFYYYGEASDALNVFVRPDLCNGPMNVPWFVSHGYLVFVPDISYKPGISPGTAAYNSVISAANYLAKLPYVDAKHMGLQGHSHGGFETYYIVTHTNLFSAAAPSDGVSDLVSRYLKHGVQPYYESGQGGIGATLWQRPDLYLKNSAVFNADKVTTPVLILHNKGDFIVNFEQGEEFYSALNRLGKKVWLLSYAGGEHILTDEKDQLDYTIRLQQFFDHYLKDAPAPKWMTGNIAPDQVTTQAGLALDASSEK